MARRRETDAVVDRPAGRQAVADAEAPGRPPADASAGETQGLSGSSTAEPEPTIDQIAQRAYEIYQSRGGRTARTWRTGSRPSASSGAARRNSGPRNRPRRRVAGVA